MKEDTSRINWKGKKYSRKELKEYQQAHQVKCANCGYKFMDVLTQCPVCGNELGNKIIKPK